MYIPGHYILNLIHSLNNNKFFPFSNQSSHPRNKKIALWGHNKLAIAQYVRPALLHLVKFWAGIKYKTNHVFTLIFRRCGARKNYEIEKNPTNYGLIVNEGFSKKSGRGVKIAPPPLPYTNLRLLCEYCFYSDQNIEQRKKSFHLLHS